MINKIVFPNVVNIVIEHLHTLYRLASLECDGVGLAYYNFTSLYNTCSKSRCDIVIYSFNNPYSQILDSLHGKLRVNLRLHSQHAIASIEVF